jgi:hypothetical protein
VVLAQHPPVAGQGLFLEVTGAYDYPRCRKALRLRGITPRIARRGIEPSQRRPPPLRGGAVAGVAGGLPAAAGAL